MIKYKNYVFGTRIGHYWNKEFVVYKRYNYYENDELKEGLCLRFRTSNPKLFFKTMFLYCNE